MGSEMQKQQLVSGGRLYLKDIQMDKIPGYMSLQLREKV